MATFTFECWHCGQRQTHDSPDPMVQHHEIRCTGCRQPHVLATAHTRAFRVAALYESGRCRCRRVDVADVYPRRGCTSWCMVCGHQLVPHDGTKAPENLVMPLGRLPIDAIARMGLAAYQADKSYELGVGIAWLDTPRDLEIIEALVVGVIGAMGKRLLEANEKLRMVRCEGHETILRERDEANERLHGVVAKVQEFAGHLNLGAGFSWDDPAALAEVALVLAAARAKIAPPGWSRDDADEACKLLHGHQAAYDGTLAQTARRLLAGAKAAQGIAQALEAAIERSKATRAAWAGPLTRWYQKHVDSVTDAEIDAYLTTVLLPLLDEWEKVGKQLDAKTPTQALVNVCGGQAENARLERDRDRAVAGLRIIAETMGYANPAEVDALELSAMVFKDRERCSFLARSLGEIVGKVEKLNDDLKLGFMFDPGSKDVGAEVKIVLTSVRHRIERDVAAVQSAHLPPLEDVLDALADLGAAMDLAMRIERGTGGWWLTIGDGSKWTNAPGGTFWELIRSEVPRLRARAAALADERAAGFRRLREVSAE